jgi:Cu-Zn family superoxide dismutase
MTRFPLARLLLALFTILIFLLSSSTGIALAQEKCELSRYVLPGNRSFPEGVTYQPETGYVFASSVVDGTIFRGQLGKEELESFLPAGSDGRRRAQGIKIDAQKRLFVSGSSTGLILVYDSTNGELLAKFDTGIEPGVVTRTECLDGAFLDLNIKDCSIINDVTILPSGDAYFTDSFSPYLFRVTSDSQGKFTLERFMDFTGTSLVYGKGQGITANINLNGIVSTPDGAYLIVAQTNTGKLFRIALADKTVTEINLGGELVSGDGLVLNGQTLYVVRNNHDIATLHLAPDWSSGQLVSIFDDPILNTPTTMALVEDCLLVTNSQFEKQVPGATPELPFTLLSIPIDVVENGAGLDRDLNLVSRRTER